MWERKIRSVRKILDALLREQRIKDETQTTLLCEAERILDDRPLASLSDSPNNPEPYPDSNGHVRNVRVRTASSVCKRDIRRLCHLEANMNCVNQVFVIFS